MTWFGSQGGLANDKELLRALNRFHDEYAREPRNLPRAKTIHTSIITELQKELKRLGKCDRLEFTGSGYEGVQVGPEVEFDIMVVNRVNGLQITKPSYNCPGFFQLQAPTTWFGNVPDAYTKWISQNNVILPNLVIQNFFGTLQKCIDTLGWRAEIKLRRHGPAVQMDVFKEGLLFSVDMVLTLEEGGVFSSNRRFVPKAFKEEEIVGEEMRNHLWRQSFSIEEKEKYRGLDRGNDCRKKCVRVIKVLLQNSDELKPINSYHLKNTIFHMNDAYAVYDWSNSNFLSCFLNVLKSLEDAIKRKELFSYFAKDVNILQNITDPTLELLHRRLRRLQTNKNHLMAVLEPGRPRYEAVSESLEPDSVTDDAPSGCSVS